ncbi:hypothetical protein OESDEN_21066 [Oesophagostomum dentatum]|uniref:Uncharacterized protein n=1 Tax=Oesophagostomum dentatum TaxID=61180 RepID=A0A0B1S5X8_OESDE|nr:hypothetical protein OESDEN_21066 [Oesophagostomum dentatum]
MPEAVEVAVIVVLWEAEAMVAHLQEATAVHPEEAMAVLPEAAAMVEAAEDTLAQHNHLHQLLHQQHQCHPNQLLWHHHHPAAKAATSNASSAGQDSWLPSTQGLDKQFLYIPFHKDFEKEGIKISN